ncbi:hypothetical protein ATANTOWER_031194 [Ataeniobius toweri]|uniref:Uncharacterized protein n=1 Tax=Ataeniobius toweri TaxID=208326 RepID=A0ABU7B962_9TELE|nr:hypothetical protein [Ataeniobius toweri]
MSYYRVYKLLACPICDKEELVRLDKHLIDTHDILSFKTAPEHPVGEGNRCSASSSSPQEYKGSRLSALQRWSVSQLW